MNGKKAREFRKRAEAMTIGKPEREYRVTNDSKTRRHFDPMTGTTQTVTPPGTYELTPRCTRSFYQQIKIGKKS